MFQLFTDSDTDITPEIAEQFGYKLISMPYSIHGKDIYPYIDFDKFDYTEFYNILREGEIPKTFALSPQAYIEYFEPTLKEGKDILYVHFFEHTCCYNHYNKYNWRYYYDMLYSYITFKNKIL